MECVLYSALIGIEVVAALIVSHYDPAHSLRPEATGATPRATSKPSSLFSTGFATAKRGIYRTLSQTIHDPSPTAFILALSLFSLAALFSHHLNRHHRLQYHFLIVGICIGVVISSSSVFIHPSFSLASKLQTVLPWTILVASLASSLIHWSVGGVILTEEKEEGNDGAEVDTDRRKRKTGSLLWEEDKLREK